MNGTQPMTRRALVVLALTTLALLPVGPAQARSGTLDPSFGTKGKVLTAFGPDYDEANAVLVQKDGKIVVGGDTRLSSTDSNFALARYRPNGTLDPAFGTGGKVTSAFTLSEDDIVSLLPTNGKIVAVGTTQDFGSCGILLARYNTNGSLDQAFGTGGAAAYPGGCPLAAAIQRDGKLLLAGLTVPTYRFVVGRFTANGALDTTFGTAGAATTTFGGVLEAASALAVEPDGRIVAAGATSNGSTVRLVIARFHSDGTLDTSFGTGGKVLTAIDCDPSSVLLQPNGKIVIVGGALGTGTSAHFVVARFNANGTLDSSFGTGGAVNTTIGSNSFPRAGALQVNGKIVAVGVSDQGAPERFFTLARYRANGSLDSTFGKSGIVTTPIGLSSAASGVALQADGKIVAAGTADIGNGGLAWDVALARYQGDTCVVPKVRGKTLTRARRLIRKATCAVGKVKRAFSRKIRKGRVVSQKPAPRRRIAAASKVDLVVSRGKSSKR
jgi:uncharacterized delta-60 repeat protein